ncbi:unnamed protein product [Medioppia subpectinata]|uniref:Protein kinase domain-containing protein n=1 Tax=Medioppia subpectinata TaxID=1979941 RepID=A0A7R9KTD5_9ACAR|nr:unnamed protein product [Medioppia subpectinata]CAG2108080.1 unnamed protein product [Medioppia subpectinata]
MSDTYGNQPQTPLPGTGRWVQTSQHTGVVTTQPTRAWLPPTPTTPSTPAGHLGVGQQLFSYTSPSVGSARLSPTPGAQTPVSAVTPTSLPSDRHPSWTGSESDTSTTPSLPHYRRPRRVALPGGVAPVMTGQHPVPVWAAPTQYLPPINRLDRLYDMAPRGYEPTHALPDRSLSGEVHVSSGDEYSGWLGGLVPTRTGMAALRAKTERDVAKVRELGFDIHVGTGREIGEGMFSQVFSGTYTAQISEFQSTRQGKRLTHVQPGQKFAAKYAQLASDVNPLEYMCHIIEKAVMKALSHPNIMAYRVVINIGHRVILRNLAGNQSPDHMGYRRVFLIMDFADHGHLLYFVDQHRKLTDQLTVRFTGELGSALGYMHANGVAHSDLHYKNILVFSAPGGQYTAKLTDFGLSVSPAIYGQLGVTVPQSEFNQKVRGDLIEFRSVVDFMAFTCRNNRGNVGADLSQVESLSNELFTLQVPLLDALKKYSHLNPYCI